MLALAVSRSPSPRLRIRRAANIQALKAGIARMEQEILDREKSIASARRVLRQLELLAKHED